MDLSLGTTNGDLYPTGEGYAFQGNPIAEIRIPLDAIQVGEDVDGGGYFLWVPLGEFALLGYPSDYQETMYHTEDAILDALERGRCVWEVVEALPLGLVEA